ncbi:MAG: hypothetical protein C0616_09155 [Desulfuromonas sp.]|nr:MAG: hypothetical protein C0616_09155 [Desulfuromonas sp.]
MPANPLCPGDMIEAHCSRCCMETYHTLITLVNDNPARVICNTCDHEHSYRTSSSVLDASLGKVSIRKTDSRRSSLSPQEKEKREWRALRPIMECDSASTYSSSREFRLHSLIKHPDFGLGVVKKSVPPHKMKVLFEDGIKTLRCG